MARTRTWSTTIPVDHTQIKVGPEKIRDVRTDIEERVDGILAGFVNTGTTNGLLLARLLTVGTYLATNPGTGAAAAIDIYGMTTGTMTELFVRNSSGNEVQMTYQGKLLAGQLLNDKYLIGIGTGDGSVNILKVNTAGITELKNPVKFDGAATFGVHPLAPNTAPSGTDLQLLPYGALRNMFDSDMFVMQTAGAITIDIKTASISSTYVSGIVGTLASKATATSYLAATDGFVNAWGTLANGDSITGLTDANNPPTTEVADVEMDGATVKENITMFVKKGNYWKVNGSGGTGYGVYWTPLGI